VLAPDANHDQYDTEQMPVRIGLGHHKIGCQTPRVVTSSLLTVTTPVARPSALSTTVAWPVTLRSDASKTGHVKAC